MRLKVAFVALLFAGLTACKTDFEPHLLRGSWKPSKEAGLSTYSVITFLGNDSLVAKTYDYGRLNSEISGRYKFDPTTSVLKTSYGDSISYDLEVKNLNKSELELLYLKTGQLQHYVRAD